MSKLIEVKVPDLGGASKADVIAINVKVGDTVAVDDALVTLEGDKASMDIPSPEAGIVKEIKLSKGDKVSQGSLILTLEQEGSSSSETSTAQKEPTEKNEESESAQSTLVEVKVPDLGGASKADVIAINVKVGDAVEIDDALVTLEGDKASMDIPSPEAGIVKEIKLSKGDKVSQGTVILVLEQKGQAPTKSSAKAEEQQPKTEGSEISNITKQPKTEVTSEHHVHAGPLVRRLARERNIDLNQVKGSARNGRITREDLDKYTSATKSSSEQVTDRQAVGDQWGETEVMALNKIKRVTAENMLRNWVTVPHVTQFDKADITELEAFRDKHKNRAEKDGYKLTPLAFIVKAIAHSLKAFPTFNASLDASGENLVLKKYYHVGVAVDTPNGLVVPVLRDVDRKSIREIAKEMGEISIKARDKALLPKDMMGSTFTVSSLGGIGGTAFTPIVNVPNVAILGISKSKMEPVYDNESAQFIPKLMLPLSLSYDHRVIDGAEAARFIVHLSACLEDLKLLLL